MPDTVSADASQWFRLILDARSMKELRVAEQRYLAVLSVIADGLTVTQAAEKVGVSGRPCPDRRGGPRHQVVKRKPVSRGVPSFKPCGGHGPGRALSQ